MTQCTCERDESRCPRCHCIMAWTFHPGVEVKVGMHFVRSERHAGAAHQRSPGPTHLGLPRTAWRTVQFFSCDEVYNFETGKKTEPWYMIWMHSINQTTFSNIPWPAKTWKKGECNAVEAPFLQCCDNFDSLCLFILITHNLFFLIFFNVFCITCFRCIAICFVFTLVL